MRQKQPELLNLELVVLNLFLDEFTVQRIWLIKGRTFAKYPFGSPGLDIIITNVGNIMINCLDKKSNWDSKLKMKYVL